MGPMHPTLRVPVSAPPSEVSGASASSPSSVSVTSSVSAAASSVSPASGFVAAVLPLPVFPQAVKADTAITPARSIPKTLFFIIFSSFLCKTKQL